MNPQHLNAVLELSYAIMHAPRRPALSDSLNRAVTLIGAGAVASIFEYLPARAAKLTYLMPPTATGQVWCRCSFSFFLFLWFCASVFPVCLCAAFYSGPEPGFDTGCG